METFYLYANRVRIPILEGLPPEYTKDYSIPGAAQRHARHGKLVMLFQALKTGHVEVAISDYLNHSDSTITCQAKTACLELHFILTGHVLFELNEFNWLELDAGHHNMIALSEVKNETAFKVTPVSTCDFHFTVDYIKKMAVKYPQLQPLLDALKKDGHASLYVRPMETSIFMFRLIVQITKAVRAGKAEDKSTAGLIEQLLIMVLENKPVKTRYRYTYITVKNIYDAHEYIKENLCKEKSLSTLIKSSGLEADHFREGFSLLYGSLPKAYLHEQKLARAKELFDEGKLTRLESIADLSGYKTVYGLVRAYQKKFGDNLQEFFK